MGIAKQKTRTEWQGRPSVFLSLMHPLFSGSCFRQVGVATAAGMEICNFDTAVKHPFCMHDRVRVPGPAEQYGIPSLAGGRKTIFEEVTPKHGGWGARRMFQVERSWIYHVIHLNAGRITKQRESLREEQ